MEYITFMWPGVVMAVFTYLLVRVYGKLGRALAHVEVLTKNRDEWCEQTKKYRTEYEEQCRETIELGRRLTAAREENGRLMAELMERGRGHNEERPSGAAAVVTRKGGRRLSLD